MSDSYTSIWCEYSENSTDIVNNTSNITVTLKCSSSGYANDSPNYWLQVWAPDGTRVGYKTGTRNFGNGTFTLDTWTGDVTHDENGNGNVTYQGYFQGTAKPDPGNTTGVYSQTLTPLPRASELTNGTIQRAIDDSMSFGVDKKISTATDKLTIKSGTVSSIVSNDYITGTTFSLSTATVNSLEKLNITGTEVSMVAQIETIVSGTTIGTNTYAFKGTFTAPTPTWTNPSVGSYNVTGVQNHNTVTVKYGGTISGVNNAAIKSIKYTIGSQVSTVTTISNSASFTNISVKDVTIQAFDGRGASVISTFVNAISTMSSYIEPTFKIDSVRRNPTMLDTGAIIEFSGTKNNYENTNISGYYRQGGSSTTTAISVGYITKSGTSTGTTTYSGNVTFPTGKFDIDKDYIVTIVASDRYTQQSKDITITKANVAMDIDLTNNRVAVGQLVPTSTTGTGSVPSNSLAVYGKIYEEGRALEDKYGGTDNYNDLLNKPTLNGSALMGELRNIFYPVGTIYMSTSSTNPQTFIGGTWVQIQDTFLLAAGTTYVAGSSGGEATHTLTTDEMPSHSHTVYGTTANHGQGWDDTSHPRAEVWVDKTNDRNPYVASSGGGQAHNNMPPYLTVYMWKRTA